MSVNALMKSAFILGLVVVLPCTTLAELVLWANSGEDKVAQHELRASQATSVVNSIWTGSEVRLFGAGNETVSFNLILEAAQSPLRDVTVTLEALVGPDGTRIESRPAQGEGLFDWRSRPIELFYVRYLQIRGVSKLPYEHYDERHVPQRFRRPWRGPGWARAGTGWQDRPDHDAFYPDIAVPLELETPFAIEAGANQSIWVDVFIPASVPAGFYHGNLVVSADREAERRVPVTLEVLPFKLPDAPHLQTMATLGYSDINRRYVDADIPFPREPADVDLSLRVRDRHFQMAHRHRISLIDRDATRHGDAPSPEWQRRFSGQLFTPVRGYEGPGTGVGNHVYSIGLFGSWDWRGEGEASMHAHTDAWVSWFDANAPQVDYFLYLMDEPEPEFDTKVNQWASWIDSNPGPGRRMKSLATMPLVRALRSAQYLDIPCACCYDDPFLAVEGAAQRILSDQEKRLWYYNGARPYTGTFATEDDGVALRVLAWSQYKKQIERWFYWETTYYHNFQGDAGQTNVFQTAQTFGSHEGFDPIFGETGRSYTNGDGVLFYPGTDHVYPQESYGVPGPFASLRLKQWRRGIQDGDYLALAQAVDPGFVSHLIETMLPAALWEYGAESADDPTWVLSDISWSTDPDQWETARRLLGRVIASGAPHWNEASRLSFRLSAAGPNPSRSISRVRLDLARPNRFQVGVFNLRGERVRTLSADAALSVGSHDFSWDGMDERGQPVAAGVYVVVAESEGRRLSHRIVRMK